MAEVIMFEDELVIISWYDDRELIDFRMKGYLGSDVMFYYWNLGKVRTYLRKKLTRRSEGWCRCKYIQEGNYIYTRFCELFESYYSKIEEILKKKGLVLKENKDSDLKFMSINRLELIRDALIEKQRLFQSSTNY